MGRSFPVWRHDLESSLTAVNPAEGLSRKMDGRIISCGDE